MNGTTATVENNASTATAINGLVIMEGVSASVSGNTFNDNAGYGIRIGNVASRRHTGTAGVVDQAERRFDAFRRDVVDGDLCAFCRESGGHVLPDAAAAAGDKDDSAVKSEVHR